MNKKNLLFVKSILSIAIVGASLALSSFAFIAQIDNTASKAEAFVLGHTYSYGKETGVWKQVEDISDISDGDQVIMGAGDIFLTGMFTTFTNTVDNRYYCEGTKITDFGGALGQDGRVYIKEDAHILKIQVQIVGDSYRFIAKNTEFRSFPDEDDYDYYKGKFDIKDKYMTFEDYDSQSNPWDASFNRTHFVSFESNKSEWTYDSEASDGARFVFRSQQDNTRFITASQVTSHFEEGDVYAFGGLNNSIGNLSCYTGVNLYKKVTEMVDKYHRVRVETLPDQTFYYEGDQICLNGLEVVIEPTNDYGYGEYIYLDYNSEPRFFSVGTAVYDISNPFSTAAKATVTYGDGLVVFEIDIDVDTNPNYTFSKVTSALDDYRGTYIIVNETENRYLNGKAGGAINSYPTNASYFNCTKTSSTIGPIPFNMRDKIFEITRTRIDGNLYYHLKNSEGKYLINNNKDLGWANTATADNAITIHEGGYISMNGRYLVEYQQGFDLYTFESYTKAALYKQDIIENTSGVNFREMSDFADYFELATNDACTNRNVTSSLWANIKAEYNSLSIDSQGYLATLAYTHRDEIDTFTIEDLVDRYDVIITAYGYEDFMLRKNSPAYQQNAVQFDSLSIYSSSYEGITIAVILTVSITSIGVLFVLIRKKKTTK